MRPITGAAITLAITLSCAVMNPSRTCSRLVNSRYELAVATSVSYMLHFFPWNPKPVVIMRHASGRLKFIIFENGRQHTSIPKLNSRFLRLLPVNGAHLASKKHHHTLTLIHKFILSRDQTKGISCYRARGERNVECSFGRHLNIRR